MATTSIFGGGTITDKPDSQPDPQLPTTTNPSAERELDDLETAEEFCFPRADLPIIINVQGKRVKGKVCSQSMCLASKVWQKFIYPPFGPSLLASPTSEGIQESEISVLDLTEEDSSALLILLRIAHLQFHMVPESLSFKELLSLAILVDFCDNIELVAPWVSRWLPDEDSECDATWDWEWLFIFWVFGRVHTFTKLAKSVIKGCTNARVTLPTQGTKTTAEMKLPPDLYGALNLTDKLLDSINKCFWEQVQKLIDVPYSLADTYHSYYSSASIHARTVKCRKNSAACDATIYGVLVLSLMRLDLWPQKDPKEVFVNIPRLGADLKVLGLKLSPQGVGWNVADLIHESCIPDIWSAVSAILQEDVNPVLDSHIRHMETQRKRMDL
ncbi:hypothetical protein HYFRA_00004633 [Hymenoscyphus fraxineus]|uniref:BTB domain-containing protein n=1 Tax=Hymenoscyphus fraxineus TaxID=746836 RepID=A0A9N9PT13_9HELO|nr:hypothetical protein HYFRA_00004633 [Hymenoscyphus fraxineus]